MCFAGRELFSLSVITKQAIGKNGNALLKTIAAQLSVCAMAKFK